MPFAYVLALTTALAGVPGILSIDPEWGGASVWDDGLAEVAIYDSHRKVYGTDRSFETTLITVKEELDAVTAVKADPPFTGRNLVTVLKTNILSRIQTENYPYNYMTSIFVRRDDPRRLLKMTQSSQEWCGTTFKEVVAWDGSPRLIFHSYFDGQADGQFPMALEAGTFVEEQLFAVMRAAQMKPSLSYALKVYEPMITSSAKEPVARSFTAEWVETEDVTTGAGSFRARRIEVRAAGGQEAPVMSFWIGEDPGRPMLRFAAADGRSLLLTRISRRNYWSRQAPDMERPVKSPRS